MPRQFEMFGMPPQPKKPEKPAPRLEIVPQPVRQEVPRNIVEKVIPADDPERDEYIRRFDALPDKMKQVITAHAKTTKGLKRFIRSATNQVTAETALGMRPAPALEPPKRKIVKKIADQKKLAAGDNS